MAQTYFDPDGLLRKYGPTKTVPNVAGEYKTYSETRNIEMFLDLTKLTSTSAIVSDQTFYPKNMFLESVELDVQVAATSAGSPTLDVGLIQTDRTTAVSATEFIAAEVLSGVLDTAGKKIIYTAGVAKAGAGIGTTITNIGYITARANTATFTAGKVVVRLKYRSAY